MDFPDLTNLTFTGFSTLLVLVAALDVGLSSVVALARGVWTADVALTYLRTHVLLRIFPIFALAALGQGIPAFDLPAFPVFDLAAKASLALYGLETVASLRDSFTGSASLLNGRPPE